MIGLGEEDVGCAVASPAARNGDEDTGSFGDEVGLEFGGQHEIAVALPDRREGCEDPSTHPEIHRAHMRAFLCAFEAEGEPTEICGS